MRSGMRKTVCRSLDRTNGQNNTKQISNLQRSVVVAGTLWHCLAKNVRSLIRFIRFSLGVNLIGTMTTTNIHYRPMRCLPFFLKFVCNLKHNWCGDRDTFSPVTEIDWEKLFYKHDFHVFERTKFVYKTGP